MQLILTQTALDKVINGQKKIISYWFDDASNWSRAFQRSNTITLATHNGKAIARATVSDVLEFSDLTSSRVHEILDFYGEDDGIAEADLATHKTKLAGKRNCTLVFLESVEALQSHQEVAPVKHTPTFITWAKRSAKSIKPTRSNLLRKARTVEA